MTIHAKEALVLENSFDGTLLNREAINGLDFESIRSEMLDQYPHAEEQIDHLIEDLNQRTGDIYYHTNRDEDEIELITSLLNLIGSYL